MSMIPSILTSEGARSIPFPVRGVVVGGIAVGIGVALSRLGGSISWGDLAILASLMVVSLLGASEARRLAAAREVVDEPAAEVAGGWMRVVVGASGPADTAGSVVVPKAPPRNDPERRSLVRRAEEKAQVGASRR